MWANLGRMEAAIQKEMPARAPGAGAEAQR
jgi:hypothetical protein